MIFWRVIRGEEGVMTAFIVSLLVLLGYHAYDHFVPSFSDFFYSWFRALHLMILIYITSAMHNSCRSNGFTARMVVRTYVVLVFMAGVWLSLHYFGPLVAAAYVATTFISPFLFRE